MAIRTGALLIVAAALGVACGAVAYLFPAAATALESTGVPAASAGAAAAVPRQLLLDDRPFTVLLLGSDDDAKFPADRVLTQSMILVRVEPAAKRATMLSIPRDLWVRLSNGRMGKIDAAYEYGGAAAALKTVSDSFDVRIDDYAWVGLKGLVDVVDALAGVDLVVTNPVLDDYYPADLGSADPYAYERVAVLPGPQHLDGTHALQYVRSRHGDLQSDFGRSQRQQQLLLAILERVKRISIADVPALAEALRGEVRTSMSVARVEQLAPLAASFGPAGTIEQVVLLPPYTHGGEIDGASVVLPDWSLIRPLVRQRFP